MGSFLALSNFGTDTVTKALDITGIPVEVPDSPHWELALSYYPRRNTLLNGGVYSHLPLTWFAARDIFRTTPGVDCSSRVAPVSLDRSTRVEDTMVSDPVSSLVALTLGLVCLGLRWKEKKRKSISMNIKVLDKKLIAPRRYHSTYLASLDEVITLCIALSTLG